MLLLSSSVMSVPKFILAQMIVTNNNKTKIHLFNELTQSISYLAIFTKFPLYLFTDSFVLTVYSWLQLQGLEFYAMLQS